MMAKRWQVANIINIRGSTFISQFKSEMILRVLMGAQERKKMKLTTISKEFVLFLRASWRDFLCDEKTEFVWRSSFWLILVYARATIAEGMRY